MKKLILLLTILSFASCAQERTSSREIQDKINSTSGAGKVTNAENLYFYYASVTNLPPEYASGLNCQDVYSFEENNRTNLIGLEQFLETQQQTFFECVGTLDEYIVAVEVNKANTGGTLFVLFVPNVKSNTQNGNAYINYGNALYYNKWGFSIDFVINNQANFDPFGSFTASLRDNAQNPIGNLTMYSNNLSDYSLSVSLGGFSPFIHNLPIFHSM